MTIRGVTLNIMMEASLPILEEKVANQDMDIEEEEIMETMITETMEIMKI